MKLMLIKSAADFASLDWTALYRISTLPAARDAKVVHMG